ncbi:WD40 repeat domain-containing protein [Herbaspirillum huttiense]|uniref:WD40 repeat domain-containing protein n=1 Tax=Herbaspirillum huttiense TaxID=863372 RepID=UPI0039F670B4
MHVLPITRASRVILIKSQEASANKKIAVVVSEEPEIIHWGEGPIYVPYSVGIWGITDLKKLSEIKDEYPIQAVAFSHNGAYVAVGNSIGTIRIYDASSGEEKASVQRSEGVRSLAFVDNDMYILSTTGPSRTYPPTGGADMIQFDKWQTEDLRRAGCRSIEGEYLSFGCSGDHR